MKTNKKNVELNIQFATLLGWTKLFTIGGTVMGCPPQGSPNSRDQAAVPNWAGDYSAIMKLAIQNRCYPQLGDVLNHMKRNEVCEEDAYRHIMMEMLEAKFRKEKEHHEEQSRTETEQAAGRTD